MRRILSCVYICLSSSVINIFSQRLSRFALPTLNVITPAIDILFFLQVPLLVSVSLGIDGNNWPSIWCNGNGRQSTYKHMTIVENPCVQRCKSTRMLTTPRIVGEPYSYESQCFSWSKHFCTAPQGVPCFHIQPEIG